jgi:hypothetical protein
MENNLMMAMMLLPKCRRTSSPSRLHREVHAPTIEDQRDCTQSISTMKPQPKREQNSMEFTILPRNIVQNMGTSWRYLPALALKNASERSMYRPQRHTHRIHQGAELPRRHLAQR